jgi:site-specific recombinase
MSDRQVYGLTLLLIGLAVLIVSAGIAWTLSLRSRTRRVEGAWIVTTVSFVLFLVGVLICWLGVSGLLGG